jgi:hypothetical protein
MPTLHRFRARPIDRLESRRVPSQAAPGLSFDVAPRLPLTAEHASVATAHAPTPVAAATAGASSGVKAGVSTPRVTAAAVAPTTVSPSLTSDSLVGGLTSSGSTDPASSAGTVATSTQSSAPGSLVPSNLGLGLGTSLPGLSPFLNTYPALGGFSNSGIAYSTVVGFSTIGLPAGATANFFNGSNPGDELINGVNVVFGANLLNALAGSGSGAGVGINSPLQGNTLLTSGAINGFPNQNLLLNGGVDLGDFDTGGTDSAGFSPGPSSLFSPLVSSNPMATSTFDVLDAADNTVPPGFTVTNPGFVTTPNMSAAAVNASQLAGTAFASYNSLFNAPNVAPLANNGIGMTVF